MVPRLFYCYEGPGPLPELCRWALRRRGWTEVGEPSESCVAIAPCLRTILTAREIAAPALGTLIFHPSLLPRHRGPDAVKWQVLGRDPFGGVTWFWADAGLDTGDVCEQELVALPAGASPKEVYVGTMVPAGVRCLERIADQLEHWYVRRVSQDAAAATYESWWAAR